MLYSLWRAIVLAFLLGGSSSPGWAENAQLFALLAGSWSGSGHIQFEGNRSERLSCKGYYTLKGGDDLGVAIRCASPSTNIELRSQLRHAGGKVTGNWEERTFNAVGDVTGRSEASSLRLDIAAPPFEDNGARFVSIVMRPCVDYETPPRWRG